MPTENWGLPTPPDSLPIAHVYEQQRALATALDGMFQHGLETISPSSSAGSSASVTITFPRPFASPPVIMLTSRLITATFGHDAQSTTAVRIWARRLTASSTAIPVAWVAIGEVAS